tara:strand:+ start:231 stop:380 length:150 start_codon:yes stop_codon:yes gene_type:complete
MIDFLLMVTQHAFGMPFSMNTMVIILFVGAMIAAFAAWLYTKMGEGFFE